jgi:MarR family transcriptional regulator for hemolysin
MKMVKTPEYNPEQPFGRILSRLGKSYLQQLNTRLNYLDIDRDYYALILIERGVNSITQNTLAQQLETDKVSIVRIIDYLSSRGYVERVRSSTDKRKYCLTLTEKARKALPGIKKTMDDLNALAFEGISETQKSAFYLSLATINNNLQKVNITGI